MSKYSALLIPLLLSSSFAHSANEQDANSAVLENMSRFDGYEQTAQQMSQEHAYTQPMSEEQNRMPAPTQQRYTETLTTTEAVSSSGNIHTQQATPEGSVYESIKLLINNGALTDKQKIKLISMLSS